MTQRSITHADFSISRNIPSSVKKVYAMFADLEAKEQWFKGPTDNSQDEHTMDFQEGGNEVNSGKFHDGTIHTFKAHYYDIVPEQRIVYCYEMYLNDQRISVSLATIEFKSEGAGTKLILHESGAFLDDFDTPELRERGTHELLKALERAVKSKEDE